MGPAAVKFLQALASLVKNTKNIKLKDAYKNAEREFGELSDVMKSKIDDIFKNSKAPSIKNPKKKSADIIPFPKKKEGIMSTKEASPMMKGIEDTIEMLQKNPKRPGGALDPATGLTRTLVRRILDKKGIEIGNKDPLEVFSNIFGDSISDVNNLAEEMLEIDRRGGGIKDMDQMLEADGFFDIDIPTNPSKGMTNDELSQFIRKTDAETAAKNRQMSVDELEDFEMEIGPDQLEGYDFDGTVGDAQRILKEAKDYQDYMYGQYKMGKLDPEAGDKSPARKRFLEKKLEEMEDSGDPQLMTRDEIEELTFFDTGTEMDEAAKKAIDNSSINDEIKRGVADVMSDTSPAALKKSIEVDNLMLEYPGMGKELAEEIASASPVMKAEMITMVEQTFKMDKMGMSGDEIIDIFRKKTDRTKQANGGLSYLMGM